MSITLRDTRNMLAAIRHDVRTGNIERARKWMGEVATGDWHQARPDELEQACMAIEVKLEESGL